MYSMVKEKHESLKMKYLAYLNILNIIFKNNFGFYDSLYYAINSIIIDNICN